MKISITCEPAGWILHRLATEIKTRITKHHITINEPVNDADINYFINYGYYREKSGAIDIGWFTHYDPNLLADLWRKAASEMDHCVTQSEASKEILMEQGVPADKISVIIPGADDRFSPKVRLGISGKIQPGGRKGERLVKRLSEDKDISSIIDLVANQDGWEVPVLNVDYPDFYLSIDFLLVPSLLEAGPVPFIEALACGKLAIAPPIGNVPQFEHIEYRTGDYEDLKRVILQTCMPIYEERRRRSLQVQQYDWRNWAAEHEKLFKQLRAQRKDCRGRAPSASKQSPGHPSSAASGSLKESTKRFLKRWLEKP